MNFQPNTSQHTIQQNRHNSISTETSLEDLLENVFNDIQEHEEKHQTKLFKNPYTLPKGSSIDDNTNDPTPSLPLSTTKLAVETKIAFITHNANKQPQISNSNSNSKYKLFSPNAFYPGQSLPILVQVHPQNQNHAIPPPKPSLHQCSQSNQSYFHNNACPSPLSLHSTYSTQSNRMLPLQTIMEEPIHKLENALRERDEDNDGALDLEEFTEALHEIDKNVNSNDLRHIFTMLINKNGNANEILIDTFMQHIRNAQKKSINNWNESISPTPMTVFRGAFPDIFGDINDIENRELWGDAQMTSIHKLETELQEEAENDGVIDFPEFEAAINNIGIDLNKAQLKKLFAHFLGEQTIYNEKKENKIRRYDTENNISPKMEKKYEVQLGFLMDYLKRKVENHQHLQPKQILQLAFMDLLLHGNLLNRQSSFLDKKNSKKNVVMDDIDDEYKIHESKDITDDIDDGDETDDSFQENPDFDKEIAKHEYGYEYESGGDDDNPTLSPHDHLSLGASSLTKGDRQLMRAGSTVHWTDMEVEQQKEEMENQLKIMQQQNSGGLAFINNNPYNTPTSFVQQRTFAYYK